VSTKNLSKIISPLDNLDIKEDEMWQKMARVRHRAFRQIKNKRTRVQ
jgi:hypothetical protein